MREEVLDRVSIRKEVKFKEELNFFKIRNSYTEEDNKREKKSNDSE